MVMFYLEVLKPNKIASSECYFLIPNIEQKRSADTLVPSTALSGLYLQLKYW